MTELIHESRPVRIERRHSAVSWFMALRRKNNWRNFLGEKRRGTPTTIINDCTDDNAASRQRSRVSSITGGPVTYVSLSAEDPLQNADSNRLEAAGHLVDQLDAFDDREGVVCVHIAPRNDAGGNGHTANGAEYGYFQYKNVIVVSSLEGSTLSLVKKLGLLRTIHKIDFDKALSRMYAWRLITKAEIEKISHTQFKSYEFLPKIGAYLLKEGNTAGTKFSTDLIQEAPKASIWFVDNFGNCKTTLVAEEYGITSHISQAELETQKEAEKNGIRVGPLTHIETRFGKLPLYRRLADVLDGEPALTIGSSGIGSGNAERRFIEFTILGGNAAKKYSLKAGDSIF